MSVDLTGSFGTNVAFTDCLRYEPRVTPSPDVHAISALLISPWTVALFHTCVLRPESLHHPLPILPYALKAQSSQRGRLGPMRSGRRLALVELSPQLVLGRLAITVHGVGASPADHDMSPCPSSFPSFVLYPLSFILHPFLPTRDVGLFCRSHCQLGEGGTNSVRSCSNSQKMPIPQSQDS